MLKRSRLHWNLFTKADYSMGFSQGNFNIVISRPANDKEINKIFKCHGRIMEISTGNNIQFCVVMLSYQRSPVRNCSLSMQSLSNNF